MVFSSYLFMFYFLPAVLIAYAIMPRRAKNLCLTLFSYFFYGWANPLFTVLMLSSTVVDYFCGLVISNDQETEGVHPTRRQRVAVVVSVITNLSLLGFFKYFNFAYENYQTLLNWLGFEGVDAGLAFRVTLPLGISFYTFQSMSYTIDIYRKRAKALHNFIDFACYVSLFSQLVAGPIIRFSEIADQIRDRRHTLDKFTRGLAFLSLGLAKKILLANPCGMIADTVFEAGSRGVLQAWYGSAAYAFQIYFDFSGYSDMAVGLGLMLGFIFPKNFDAPYRSSSITEFWRRWHISLSSWLRDYLYLPLGGNRRGSGRTYLNLFTVMLLGGLWHGAAWNFVIWGGLHGLLLAGERRLGKKAVYAVLPQPLRVSFTFVILMVTWVFFRAHDLPSAITYLGNMVGIGTVQEGAPFLNGILFNPYYFGVFILAGVVTWACPQTWKWTERISWAKAIVILSLFWLALTMMTTQAFNPFIYFIF